MFGRSYSKTKKCIELEPEYTNRTHRRVIILYDLDGLPVGEFNRTIELAQYLKMKVASVNTQMCKGRRLRRKYTAEWVVIERENYKEIARQKYREKCKEKYGY